MTWEVFTAKNYGKGRGGGRPPAKSEEFKRFEALLSQCLAAAPQHRTRAPEAERRLQDSGLLVQDRTTE